MDDQHSSTAPLYRRTGRWDKLFLPLLLALGALLLALTWLGEPGHRFAGAGLLLLAAVLAIAHLRNARRQPQPLLRCASRCWVAWPPRSTRRWRTTFW